MEFKLAGNKSDANQHRHGIDFIDAQRLWGDDNRIRLISVRRARKEEVRIYEG